MQKLQSNLQNMVIVLTAVAVICGGLLAFVNMKTAEPRQAAAEKTLNDGIAAVLGGNAGAQKEAPKTVTRTVNGKSLDYTIYKMENGTAVKSTDPNGFGGNLTILVGFDNDGTIKGYTVLQTSETPGLGAKAATWFKGDGGEKANIIGKNPGKVKFAVTKGGEGDIDAITASTITSRAFLRAVQQAYNTFNENK